LEIPQDREMASRGPLGDLQRVGQFHRGDARLVLQQFEGAQGSGGGAGLGHVAT